MVDIASTVFGSFQDSLVSVFGSSAGWAIGHLILLGFVGLAIFGIKEREHIINHSGVGRKQTSDAMVTLGLTILLFYLYTSIMGFATFASVGIAGASSLSMRWLITILG